MGNEAVFGIGQRRDTLESRYLTSAFIYALRGVSYGITSRELVRQVPNQQPFTAAFFRGLAPLRPPLIQKCYRYALIKPLTNGRYTDIM